MPKAISLRPGVPVHLIALRVRIDLLHSEVSEELLFINVSGFYDTRVNLPHARHWNIIISKQQVVHYELKDIQVYRAELTEAS